MIINFAIMKKSRHSETEMVNAVRQLESGVSGDVTAREHGISRTTLDKRKMCVSRHFSLLTRENKPALRSFMSLSGRFRS